MTVQHTVDEEAIFNFARKLGSESMRDAYLRQVCGNDHALYDRVATLLRSLENSPSFLELPPSAVGATTDRLTNSEMPDEVIGNYKLLQKIGEGGFGVVYMAQQTKSRTENFGWNGNTSAFLGCCAEYLRFSVRL